jgi:hypothetical protein
MTATRPSTNPTNTLTKLQAEGRVTRIGPTNGGHWKVLN